MHIAPQEFKEVQALVRSLCGLVLTDDPYVRRVRAYGQAGREASRDAIQIEVNAEAR